MEAGEVLEGLRIDRYGWTELYDDEVKALLSYIAKLEAAMDAVAIMVSVECRHRWDTRPRCDLCKEENRVLYNSCQTMKEVERERDGAVGSVG